MSSFQQVSSTRHEYQMKTWKKALCVSLGVLLTAGGFALGLASTSGQERPVSLITTLFFLAGGLYMLAWALRARLITEGSRIEVRSAFREQSADLGEIEGFRTISARNGSYTQLCLKQGRGTITVSRDFDTDENYQSWFQQLTDLDKRDRDALLDEISRQEDLGATPTERLGALATAKTWSIFAVIISIAAAVALNFGEAVFLLPAAAVLALMPVVVLFMVWQSPLLYAVYKAKADPRAELGFVLMVAGFGLLIRNRGVHMVSMQPLLWLIALITLAYIGALYGSIRTGRSVWGRMIGLLFFAGIYSYALVVLTDTLPDHSQATPYRASVIGKHISSGRSTSYILHLAPWGPLQNSNSLSVGSDVYRATQVGDEVCLDLYRGTLHAPWYKDVPCNLEYDPNTTP